MNITDIGLGVLLIEPDVYTDDRGYFKETYNSTRYGALPVGAMQSNQSVSKKGVIRGLHYQYPAVAKLVWVARGAICDVAFDLKTGKHVSSVLTDTNHFQMLTPAGFAHGFQALMDDTIVCYMMDGVYNPEGDHGINPLIIDWPLKRHIISDKDKNAPEFPAYQ